MATYYTTPYSPYIPYDNGVTVVQSAPTPVVTQTLPVASQTFYPNPNPQVSIRQTKIPCSVNTDPWNRPRYVCHGDKSRKHFSCHVVKPGETVCHVDNIQVFDGMQKTDLTPNMSIYSPHVQQAQVLTLPPVSYGGAGKNGSVTTQINQKEAIPTAESMIAGDAKSSKASTSRSSRSSKSSKSSKSDDSFSLIADGDYGYGYGYGYGSVNPYFGPSYTMPQPGSWASGQYAYPKPNNNVFIYDNAYPANVPKSPWSFNLSGAVARQLWPAQEQRKYFPDTTPVYPLSPFKFRAKNNGTGDTSGELASFVFSMQSITPDQMPQGSNWSSYYSWLNDLRSKLWKDPEVLKVFAVQAPEIQAYFAANPLMSVGFLEAVLIATIYKCLQDNTDFQNHSQKQNFYANAGLHFNIMNSMLRRVISPTGFMIASNAVATYSFQLPDMQDHVPQKDDKLTGKLAYNSFQLTSTNEPVLPEYFKEIPMVCQTALMLKLFLVYSKDRLALNTGSSTYEKIFTGFWPILDELENYIRRFYCLNESNIPLFETLAFSYSPNVSQTLYMGLYGPSSSRVTVITQQGAPPGITQIIAPSQQTASINGMTYVATPIYSTTTRAGGITIQHQKPALASSPPPKPAAPSAAASKKPQVFVV
jgi:hypothetical protein